MATYKFNHVHIESVAVNVAPHEVTSAELEDRIAPLYKSLGVPFGTLERVSGIKSRRLYDANVSPSMAGIPASQIALDDVGFDKSLIRSVFNCSVGRDHFEPATAALVHKAVGLDPSAMVMDITNACLGFSNGMMILANMIESGMVKAGLLVSAEVISGILDGTVRKLTNGKDTSREELLKMLPTFTLGSGAVAMVMAHESVATKPHKLTSGGAYSATQFADLCVGNADFCFYMEEGTFNPLMETDSPNLIGNGAIVGSHVWKEMKEAFGYDNNSYDVHISHQVGRQLGDKFFNTVGVDNKKEFTTYQQYGNQVSAALPTCFATAIEKGVIKSGSKALLTGFGSGLNSIFSTITW